MQRLHDDVAVLAPKRFDLRLIARDQRRRHELRIIHHEQLLGGVPNADRIVHDECCGRQPLQKMCRGDVGEIKWRILPQQHHIHRRKIEGRWLAERIVIAKHVADRDAGSAGDDTPVA